MSTIDKALRRLEQNEQESVRKFWRIQKAILEEERQRRQRNVLLKSNFVSLKVNERDIFG